MAPPTPATTNNSTTTTNTNTTPTTALTTSTTTNAAPKNQQPQQPPMNFTTSDIGASFIASYYGTLTQKPQKLILLYKPTSQVTHSIHDGETDVQHFVGLDQISPALSDFTNELAKNVKVKLHSVECQGALESSVLILVNGALQKTNTSTPESVQFTQTFLLAPQKNGYYVANDILRLEVPKSQSFNSIRDSIEVDSTAATQGEGSVVSAGQLDQEDVLSSDSALNGDSVSEPKSIESEKEEEEKQKKVKKVKKEKKTKASQKPAQTEQTAASTTTPAAATQEPAATQPAAEKKKKTRKPKTEEKQQQQPAKKEETVVAAPKPDVPTTYASIVGGDDYVATQPQQKTEKKKFNKTKKFEKTEKKEGSGSKSEEQPKKKFFAEKKTAPEKEKAPKPVEKTENGTPSTPNTDAEQPFEKKKSRFDRTKTKKEFTAKNGTEGKPLRRKFVESEEKYGIYVSKVDPNTTSQQLQEAFSKYGEIVDMNNRAKNNEKKPKFKLGYALIFFKTQEAMKKALEDKEISIGDNKVAISEHSKREKPEKFQEKSASTSKQQSP